MSEFLVYARFFNEGESQEIVDILKKEAIPYKIEQEVNQLDPIYIGSNLDPMITLRVQQKDFKTVNKLMEDYTASNLKYPDPIHYLNEFSNDELKDVLHKADEWNVYDRMFAQRLLADRGISITEKNISREDEVVRFEPERLSKQWITLGYVLSVLGFIGIFVGLVVLSSNKTLSNGRRVKMYDDYSRDHARNMVVFSLIVAGLALFIRFSYSRS